MTTESMPSPDLDPLVETRVREALAAHVRGWALTPLGGKIPKLTAWASQPFPTEAQVVAWARIGNLGVRTGPVSGFLYGIDDDTLELSAARELGLPDTVTAITGSGRRHHYFIVPGITLGNSNSTLLEGVDVRGEGGQLVLPGSIHPDTGRPYLWLEGHAPGEIPFAQLPASVIEQILTKPAKKNKRAKPTAPFLPISKPTGKVIGFPPGAPPVPADAPPPIIPTPTTRPTTKSATRKGRKGDRLQKYAIGALNKCIEELGAATEGSRNATLNTQAFAIGRFVGAALLDRTYAENELRQAATVIGLESDEIERTIASGLGDGAANPHDPAELLRAMGPARTSRGRNDGLHLASDLDRPTIKLEGGQLSKNVGLAETALLAAVHDQIFSRGGQLVRLIISEDLSVQDRLAGCRGPLAITPLNHVFLADMLTEVVEFLAWNKKLGAFEAEDCPDRIAKSLISRSGIWKAPPLTGIICAPTMKPNGTILQAAGYDLETGLFLDSGGIILPLVPSEPSIDDARAAILRVKSPLLDRYPFVAPADRSVILAAMLTALIRHSLRAAPLFLIRAPKMASGKTTLADLVALIATGRTAAPFSQGRNEEEDAKRMLAILLESRQVVLIDNIERPLGGAALCSVLTETSYSDRLLGFNRTATVSTAATFLATGNNVAVSGDLISRVLPCDIDPAVEHPEARTFELSPRKHVVANRGQMICDLLTLARAYHVAGRPSQGLPTYGRYEEWSDLVRSALVWIGEADPWLTRERLATSDPVGLRLAAVLSGWRDLIGDQIATTGDLVRLAEEHRSTRPLFSALREVAPGERGSIDSSRLGHYLRRYVDRIESGVRIQRAGVVSGVVQWRLVHV